MESEHAAMSAALADTAHRDERLRGQRVGRRRRGRPGEHRCRTREVVERHLHHEETELEPQLDPHLETPEWKAVEKKLRAVVADGGRAASSPGSPTG